MLALLLLIKVFRSTTLANDSRSKISFCIIMTLTDSEVYKKPSTNNNQYFNIIRLCES